MTLTFGSLFAGIGGIDLGLERAGMRCEWQVEIDPFCRKVLNKHWPDVPKYEDVRDVGKHNLEPVDLIAGGIPCQPHSLNGERRGAADDRNLWPEYFRVVRELKPAWVILENVPGIVTTMLDDIVSDLEGENYQARTVIVPACAFGAPHIRERVFVVAYSEGVGWERGGDTRKGRHGPANRSESLADSASKRRRSQQEGADTYGGCEIFHPESQGLQNRYPRSSTKQEGEGAFCGLERPNWWAVEPNVGGAIDGFPSWLDRNRGLTIQSHKCILSYVIGHNQGVHNANAAQNRGREVLQKLQREAGKESIQRTAGGFGGVSAEEVLLTYLRKLEEASEELDYFSLESEEIQEGSLRGVQWENEPTGSPHRPESRKQRTGEFTDSLQALSRLLAHHSQKAWAVYRRENASAILNGWLPGWEDGFNRMAHGVPNRMDRIRGLGNAVVPQVAEWIGRRIMEAQ